MAMQTENRKDFDLDRLLHPAGAFRSPVEVVNDPDMTTQEKRAILASWASDACAVEAAPDLRQPAGSSPVRFDDIMDALKRLDGRRPTSRPTANSSTEPVAGRIFTAAIAADAPCSPEVRPW
jgi:hypothetical protein